MSADGDTALFAVQYTHPGHRPRHRRASTRCEAAAAPPARPGCQVELGGQLAGEHLRTVRHRRGDRHRRRPAHPGVRVRLGRRAPACRWWSPSSASASARPLITLLAGHRRQHLRTRRSPRWSASASASTTRCCWSPATSRACGRAATRARPPAARSPPPARRSSSPAPPCWCPCSACACRRCRCTRRSGTRRAIVGVASWRRRSPWCRRCAGWPAAAAAGRRGARPRCPPAHRATR